jgi:hypothetical protein
MIAKCGRHAAQRLAAVTAVIFSLFLILHSSFIMSARAAPPSTDPAMNSILGFSNAPAATRPAATEPVIGATPLKNQEDDDEARAGVITMSDGKTIRGKIATTSEKPIRVWVEAQKDYTDVPLSMIDKAEAEVVWERVEKEWNFKESGSDIKVYSGRTYPARETKYKLTLTDCTTVDGGIVAPLYVTTDDGKTKTCVLYKRDKGQIGQTLADLPYVKSVTFSN